MNAKILEFLEDESGQTSTEYILLLVIVAILIFKVGGRLKEELLGLVDKVFKSQALSDITNGNI